MICEEHFRETHTRSSTGRYIVKMLLKADSTRLGRSRDIALKRLNSLWKHLIREPKYLSLYREFMHEYKELGHMNEIENGEEQEGNVFHSSS